MENERYSIILSRVNWVTDWSEKQVSDLSFDNEVISKTFNNGLSVILNDDILQKVFFPIKKYSRYLKCEIGNSFLINWEVPIFNIVNWGISTIEKANGIRTWKV